MADPVHRRGASYRLDGLQLTDHHFELPLDSADPGHGALEIFAREVSRSGGEQLPFLVFFQGGPGFEATRPMEHGGWIGKALEEHRVLLLDQRGTGRSSAIDAELLGELGTPEAQAEHLALHRADNIVRDAEAIRRALLGPDGRWSILGQSFGGFCAVTYLSFHPEHLDAAYITGGLPPIGVPARDVYAATFATLGQKNARYFERFPEDRERLTRLAEAIRATGGPSLDATFPDGDRLSVERLQSLGIKLGMSDGPATLHWLLELALTKAGRPSQQFLRRAQALDGFSTNPLYAALHESCYADGPCATDFAAHDQLTRHPAFHADAPEPLWLGEMIFPWMFEQQRALEPFRDTAHLLAEHRDWPALYHTAQLARNEVPCAAAVYADDLFVDRELSLATAARIHGCRTWITNEYEHNGLRADGARVLGRLLELARD